MSDDVVAEQVEYYRRRAREYDTTAYGDVRAAQSRIARIVRHLQPTGRVLEIACGTGLWTEALARTGATVTAIDAAPEMIELARERVAAENVGFEVAQVLSWCSDERFDVIFFSAWLSHVPSVRFDEFWQWLRGLLATDGRVLFVDEHVDERSKESYLANSDGVVQRRLGDGRTFRVVKHFIDPDALRDRLRGLGWSCEMQRDGTDWVVGEARPAP